MVSKIIIRNSNNSDTKGRHHNSKGHKWRDLLLSNSNVMKGPRHNKGHRWRGLFLSSSGQHRRWISVEWNVGVKMAAAEICSNSKVQMIITSVEADLEEEEMDKKIVPM